MSGRGAAVVVGATGPIGRAIGARLRGDGHPLVAVARSAEPLERLASELPGTETVCADVAAEGFEQVVGDALVGRPVAVAVHVAAAPAAGDVRTVPTSALLAAVDVKVAGLLRLVRGVGAGLGRGSRIVAVGGSLAYDPTPAGATAGVANAAQANLVRQLSQTLGPDGVSCHVVAPGPVDTPRLRRLAEDEAAADGTTAEAVLDRMAGTSPVGRLTTPEEVAWAVARLTEPEAEVLTGGTLLLDAGRRTAIP